MLSPSINNSTETTPSFSSKMPKDIFGHIVEELGPYVCLPTRQQRLRLDHFGFLKPFLAINYPLVIVRKMRQIKNVS